MHEGTFTHSHSKEWTAWELSTDINKQKLLKGFSRLLQPKQPLLPLATASLVLTDSVGHTAIMDIKLLR
jgi:hypothetical protein